MWILFKPLFQLEVNVGNVHDVIFHLHSRQNKHALGMGLKGGGSKSWVWVVKRVVVSFSKGSSKFGFFGPGGGSKKKTYVCYPIYSQFEATFRFTLVRDF